MSLKKTQSFDLKIIKTHQQRVQKFLEKANKNTQHLYPFKIIDTCRLDNHRIFSFETIGKFTKPNKLANLNKFVALIPAAGASSRYFEIINELKYAYIKDNWNEFKKIKQKILSSNLVIPSVLNHILSHEKPSYSDFNKIDYILKQPKGLQPAVHEGFSFLQIKCLENLNMHTFLGQVYISPINYAEQFLQNIEVILNQYHQTLPTTCYEQSQEMCTLRFDPSGKPIKTGHTDYSLVSAGHGALIELFPKIKKDFTNVQSIFINNVDNTFGMSKKVKNTLSIFLQFHSLLLSSISKIRKNLNHQEHKEARQEAEKVLSKLGQRKLETREKIFLSQIYNSNEQILWMLLFKVFHCPVPSTHINSIKKLNENYHKPLNTFGQVRRLPSDKGGIPVIAQSDWGEMALCLEMLHINKNQCKKNIDDINYSTHFNPVCVASEVQDSIANYKNDHPFWTIVQKQWKDQDVYYHETLLYELIGNSYMSNLCFVEIPRFMFKPHKSILNTRNNNMSLLQ